MFVHCVAAPVAKVFGTIGGVSVEPLVWWLVLLHTAPLLVHCVVAPFAEVFQGCDTQNGPMSNNLATLGQLSCCSQSTMTSSTTSFWYVAALLLERVFLLSLLVLELASRPKPIY